MTFCDATQPLVPASTRLKDWCQHEALPFWLAKGIDHEGGFYERLLADGSPDREAL